MKIEYSALLWKLLLCTVVCFSFTRLTAQQLQPDQNKRLNVVFILADDLGWKDLGCYGSDFYETPHIDALAEDGMRFTRAYAASPVCSPTRASILTGQYPVRTGVTDIINIKGAREPEHWKRNTPLLPAHYVLHLPLSASTLAEAIKAAGYVTYVAGKWHLGPKGYWPESHGFDHNEGGWSRGQPSSYFSPYHNPKLTDGPKDQYLPIRLTHETIDFMEQYKDTLFFIYQSLYLVHTPLEAKKRMIEKYKQKKERLALKAEFGLLRHHRIRLNQCNPVYAAMVEAMDDEVGRLVKALKEEGLYNHTLIIFTSDNGGLSTSEGRPTSNLPLKGGKGWMYEGGIRTPLIIRWPGVTKPGSISKAVVSSIDFYPTVLDIVHQPLPSYQHIDGETITPVLKGKRQQKRTLYWHYPHYSNQGGEPASCIMKDDWKLIKWYDLKENRYALFNVNKDIGEKKNLSSRYPKKTADMKAELERFLRSVSAKYPTPNPKYTTK